MQAKPARDAWFATMDEDFAGARRGARLLVLPLMLALPSLAWVVEATRRASLETLGRDQGIFQYIARVVSHGARDYRDVRDVNGPLTHAVHMVFLALGGADEHRFRVLDLAVTGASFALVGACLPGLSRKATDAAPTPLERVGWAFAAWVVLSAQYLHYLFWDLAQRESFFDWFMLVSVGAQIAALTPCVRPRTRTLLLVASGVLSVIPWFGKPTYALFTFAQLLAFAFAETDTPDARRQRRRWIATFVVGGAVGALTQVIFLLIYADLGAFVRIYFIDVPRFYRFIWPRTFIDSLNPAGSSTMSALAPGVEPRHARSHRGRSAPEARPRRGARPPRGAGERRNPGQGLPVPLPSRQRGALPAGARAGRRAVRAARTPRRRGSDGPRPAPAPCAVRRRVRARAGGRGGAALFAPPRELGILQKGVTAGLRQSSDYFVVLPARPTSSPGRCGRPRRTSAPTPGPTTPCRSTGCDPYLLFLADRRSATPYIYAYDLDADAALTGSSLPEGLHPTWDQAEQIRAMRDANERDFLARIQTAPPAAFVFMDRSPLISEDDDAWLDFAEHNEKSAPWVREHYKQTAAFGDDCVWMRRDLAEGMDENQAGAREGAVGNGG